MSDDHRLRHQRGILPAVVFVALFSITVFAGNQDFRRADLDGNSMINIVDPIVILNYLLGNSDLTCIDAADVDDDGSVNIVDVIYLLFYVFGESFPEPLPPFLDCGPDPTPDSLGCESYPGCP